MKMKLEKKVELKYLRRNCREYNTDRSRQVCEFQKESRISNPSIRDYSYCMHVVSVPIAIE